VGHKMALNDFGLYRCLITVILAQSSMGVLFQLLQHSTIAVTLSCFYVVLT